MSRVTMQDLVNHVALPPKLPGKADESSGILNEALSSYLLDGIRGLAAVVTTEIRDSWDAVRFVISSSNCYSDARLDQQRILAALRSLDVNGYLVFHIAEQNAGLLIYRIPQKPGFVTFESFECSAPCEKVLASKSALRQAFPLSTVEIPLQTFTDASIELADFLERASIEKIKRFAAKTDSSAAFISETRDTTDPSLITTLLMTMLEALGHRADSSVLVKRIRDDVIWSEGTVSPWRRSPFWLTLRVGVARFLAVQHGGEAGRIHYKFLLNAALARFLEREAGNLDPDVSAFLNSKLSRRFSKLEIERQKAAPAFQGLYRDMFDTVGSYAMNKALRPVRGQLERSWNQFKADIRRPIGYLPRRANYADLTLTLENSSSYLREACNWRQTETKQPKRSGPTNAFSQLSKFAQRYFDLADIESGLYDYVRTETDATPSAIIDLANRICKYMASVGDLYEDCSIQKSTMILLIMQAWTVLDEHACYVYPLLRDYALPFSAALLDVLKVPNMEDLKCLQAIQHYLLERSNRSRYGKKTIFDLFENCFASRYFDEARDAVNFQELKARIEEEAEVNRTAKVKEWKEKSKRHAFLVEASRLASCVCPIDSVTLIRNRNACRNCPKCSAEGEAKRMRIEVHEHPLPTNESEAKSVVFELNVPDAFRAYRHCTAEILGSLARKPRGSSQKIFQAHLLRDYSELQGFWQAPDNSAVALASVQKSFLQMHYRFSGFPVPLDDICLQNRLRLRLYDVVREDWAGDLSAKAAFDHHMSLELPKASPFAEIFSSPQFALGGPGPSSNEIIASQTSCPLGLSAQEFMAAQTLLSGTYRRLPSLLVELGNSNLNFSNESIVSIAKHVLLTAGPNHVGATLRDMHHFFQEEKFCSTLLQQLKNRVASISSNYREHQQCDLILLILFRIIQLASPEHQKDAIELVEAVRSCTLDWLRQLRQEIQACTDPSASRISIAYQLFAACLCKRTFSIYKDTSNIDVKELAQYVEASIALHDSVDNDPSSMPPLARRTLISDMRCSYNLQNILYISLLAQPQSLQLAVAASWPRNAQRKFSPVSFLDSRSWWAQMDVTSTSYWKPQVVQYHILTGEFLVDGFPVGKLPAKHRNAKALKQLFPMQDLLIWPSNMPGMLWRLALNVDDHEIHLGYRGESLIVRAIHKGLVHEFIPRELFLDPANGEINFDLPLALIEDCCHWLNLTTRVIEVRQAPKIWQSGRRGNWKIDFRTRSAKRRTVSLVDPRSRAFRRIANAFKYFEHPGRLTVHQPEKFPLTVELRRLDLKFYVNTSNLLQCSQLRSEIDPNQDCGTWYGLKNMLVLRSVVNPKQRSIITPMGVCPVTFKRHGQHVAVYLSNDGSYGIFGINETLRRLDCTSEPRLLYLKAFLHAATSHHIPDTLTGMTGGQMALRLLKSGQYQPWTPFRSYVKQILTAIASLAPERTYYPPERRTMTKVSWNKNLTTTIQRDDLNNVVQSICDKSTALSVFSILEEPETLLIPPAEHQHLVERAHARRRVFQPRDSGVEDLFSIPPDLVYEGRGCKCDIQAKNNVFEIATLLHRWPTSCMTPTVLADVLEKMPEIGGFNYAVQPGLLSERLEMSLADHFGAIVNLCCLCGKDRTYSLLFLFSPIAFRNDVDMDLLRVFIAFAFFNNELRPITPPRFTRFSNFHRHSQPTKESLMQLLEMFAEKFDGGQLGALRDYLDNKTKRKLAKEQQAHEARVRTQCGVLADFLLEQWPCLEPSLENAPKISDVDASKALKEVILTEWRQCFANWQLSVWLDRVQVVLKSHWTRLQINRPITEQIIRELPRDDNLQAAVPAMADLTRKSIARTSLLSPANANPKVAVMAEGTSPHAPTTIDPVSHTTRGRRFEIKYLQHELRRIIQALSNRQDKNRTRQDYSAKLSESLDSLIRHQDMLQGMRKEILPQEASRASEITATKFETLITSLGARDTRCKWLREGLLWPVITPITLLETLRSTSTTRFGNGMRSALIDYGIALTGLQKALRIEDATAKNDTEKLRAELLEVSHSNWDPTDFTDWLLIEIDCNLQIRANQADVARATISPPSQSNSVLQLNMGQGKTSVIFPMVAAVLADSNKLLRLVVPNALLFTTAQLLSGRLGGLLNREIRHVPFSRKMPNTPAVLKRYFDIHRDIKRASGMMITLPEHVLSFKLSGLQRLVDGRLEEAGQLIRIENWLKKWTRQVIDECDYVLNAKTQLVYPSGSQGEVDGAPERWQICQTVLMLVRDHLFSLKRDYPRSLEVLERPQGFPVPFFLRSDVENALIDRLVRDVILGQAGLPVHQCTKKERSAVRRFISEAEVSHDDIKRIKKLFPGKPAFLKGLHLIRGLFVHRILLLVLRRRYFVHYGLDSRREPIAVPYNAKGTPSNASEWGHPDVCILFTILSFYYRGLDMDQIRESVRRLQRSDDPALEYQTWRDAATNLPDGLAEWSSINVDDEAQLKVLWDHLRFAIPVIHHYLNSYVFVSYAKQFSVKITASGWDLIGLPADSNITSGFSGTNDTLLPFNILQEDLPSLGHTNAEVLTYLLASRNREVVRAADFAGKRLSEEGLLVLLARKGLRILIDAGANIIEMDNLSLVKAWLKKDNTAEAAVYFNDGNKLYVHYRNGNSLPLAVTPFADDLNGVLIYLDHAHCRGTDLRFHEKAKGAMTLGLGLTKDSAVQAAMRLRQLGSSQSLCLIAPPEVYQSVLDHCKKTPRDWLDSSDVVYWLLEQTCISLEALQPLHHSQGQDFLNRQQAARDYSRFLEDPAERDAFTSIIKQPEREALESMYRPKSKAKASKKTNLKSPDLLSLRKMLEGRRKGFRDTGHAVHGSALEEVTQEREQERETESVVQRQKPVHYRPYGFAGLARDILRFVETGTLPANGIGFLQLSEAWRRFTALGRKHAFQFDSECRVFVSQEFMKTVKLPLDSPNDQFLRSVSWIVWSDTDQTALLVMPEEAEAIIPVLYGAVKPRTGLLAYAAPVTKKVAANFNNLDYYAIPAHGLPANLQIPRWVTVAVGLWAGRLYFDFEEYDLIHRYLGIRDPSSITEEVMLDGAAEYEEGVEEGASGTVAKQPLVFAQEWIGMRTKQSDFSYTPMGYVCGAKPLTNDHHFFSKAGAAAPIRRPKEFNPSNLGKPGSSAEDEEEDEDDRLDAKEYDEGDALNEDDNQDDYQNVQDDERYATWAGEDKSK